jgi:glutamine synthetase
LASLHHPALEKLRKSNASKVKVAVSDIDGILRGKFLHIDKFEGAADGGFGFCDVVLGWDMHDVTYDNTQVTGWQHGFPDALARIDLGTARNVPWDGGVPFFLGEFVNADGSPHPLCPRQTLKRVLAAPRSSATRSCAAWSSSGSTSGRRRTAGPARTASRRSRSRPACSAIRSCAWPTTPASSTR